MTFEPGKEYKTRDGRRARVYAVDGGGEWPIHGAIMIGMQIWKQVEWRLCGLWGADLGRVDSMDLMPPELEKITLRMAVYETDNGKWFATSSPDVLASCGAKLVSHIPITFHRGEGLK